MEPIVDTPKRHDARRDRGDERVGEVPDHPVHPVRGGARQSLSTNAASSLATRGSAALRRPPGRRERPPHRRRGPWRAATSAIAAGSTEPSSTTTTGWDRPRNARHSPSSTTRSRTGTTTVTSGAVRPSLGWPARGWLAGHRVGDAGVREPPSERRRGRRRHWPGPQPGQRGHAGRTQPQQPARRPAEEHVRRELLRLRVDRHDRAERHRLVRGPTELGRGDHLRRGAGRRGDRWSGGVPVTGPGRRRPGRSRRSCRAVPARNTSDRRHLRPAAAAARAAAAAANACGAARA